MTMMYVGLLYVFYSGYIFFLFLFVFMLRFILLHIFDFIYLL